MGNQQFCHECGKPMKYDTGGVTFHTDLNGYIDAQTDKDHEPYTLNKES